MIKITSEVSNLGAKQSKHTRSYIFQQKILATGLSAAKTLVKYNSNRSQENEEGRGGAN